jgi:hypothetical protein
MPIDAFAAMDATLSSGHARSGDTVLLLTDDHGGTGNYQGLAAENHQPIYLAPTTGDFAQSCGGPSSRQVGQLDWRGNGGGLAFVTPSLATGDYWLFMKTSGQCWRIGGTSGILVLSIGTIPADNQDAAARWRPDALAPSPRTPAQPVASTRSNLLLPAALAAVLAVAFALATFTKTSQNWFIRYYSSRLRPEQEATFRVWFIVGGVIATSIATAMVVLFVLTSFTTGR